jgi:predicted NAD/FAD-binding protein
MRIAVVGAGISGLASAWLLSRKHEVTLFEANNYLGGHTHTHEVVQRDLSYRIDTGFIVHNPRHYPLFTRFLSQLGVQSQPTTMSFSVHNEASGLEYNAATLDTLFCQRINLLSSRFIGMVRDLMRFYREAPELLRQHDSSASLGDYLRQHRYGAAFRDEHLLPMASALWSSPPAQILDFPARYLVQFMANHQMLQVNDRPQWRVVKGGSSAYVQALRARWPVRERLNCPVHSVRRHAQGVELRSASWRNCSKFARKVTTRASFACGNTIWPIAKGASASARSALHTCCWQNPAPAGLRRRLLFAARFRHEYPSHRCFRNHSGALRRGPVGNGRTLSECPDRRGVELATAAH